MSYLPADPSIIAMFSYASRRMGQRGTSSPTVSSDGGGSLTDPLSVFASRLSTSNFHFNKRTRMFEWERYASRLSGPSSIAPDPEKNQVYLPWPALKLPKAPSRESLPLSSGSLEPRIEVVAREWDVSADDVKLQAEAAKFLPPDQAQSPSSENLISMTPTSSRAPPPSDQSFSDTYIDSVDDRTHPYVEAAMPLYLSEELSPRFSRAKQTRGWNLRRLEEAEERAEIGRLAVEEWEAQGRDQGLKDMLAKGGPAAGGLEGVTIRSRTRQEVRDAAMAEYDESLSSKQRMVQHARKMGLKWDRHIESWEEMPEPMVMPGGQLDKASIKRDRKVRRAQRLENKLADMKLDEGRNMVVPPGLRAQS